MFAGQVAPAVAARVRGVGGEQPDVVAVDVRGHAATERSDRPAVRQPGRRTEQRIGATCDGRRFAGLDLDDHDVAPLPKIGVAAAIRGERDPRAIRRPGGRLVGRRPIGQAACFAGPGVDEPQVRDLVVDEARAVEHVAEPVDIAVIGFGRAAGLAFGGLAAATGVILAGRAV